MRRAAHCIVVSEAEGVCMIGGLGVSVEAPILMNFAWR